MMRKNLGDSNGCQFSWVANKLKSKLTSPISTPSSLPSTMSLNSLLVVFSMIVMLLLNSGSALRAS